jgi:soluble lytic murein transglycosylase
MKFRRKLPLKTRRIIPAVAVLALTAGPSVPLVFAHSADHPEDGFGLLPPSLLLAQLETPTPVPVPAPAPAPAPASQSEAQRAAIYNAPGMPGVRMMVPNPDPAPSQSTIRSVDRPTPSGDALLLQQALSAASQGDWSRALSLSEQSTQPVVKNLVEWRYVLDEDSGASFDAINSFLNAHPRWPRHDAMVIRAEKTMPPDYDPAQVIAWYGGRVPLSGTGMIRLGEALMQTGRAADGAVLIKKAWIEFTYSPSDENNIVAAHGDILGPDVQKQRLDYLLAHDDIGGARRQVARVSVDVQRLGNARLQIKQNPDNVRSVLATLPVSQQADSEFIFDVARALRRRGDDDDAWVAMEKAPTAKDALVMPERWSVERQIMARDAMKVTKFDLAYHFASTPELDSSSGERFMDAEFLSGWIALRFLHNTDLAYQHFQRLANGVTYPISVARAHYWLGRTAEAAGDYARAAAEYARAAEFPMVFYGQLALAKMSATPVMHVADASNTPSPAARATFYADDRVQAIRVLAEAGDRGNMRLFAAAIANDPPLPDRLQMLADLMAQTGDTAEAVRIAKTASYSGYNLVNYLHPLIPLPTVAGGPEPALVLAITRQESEFDPTVVSGAGARGLMQLIPASAQRAANALGLPYRPGDLTANPSYNVQLGMQTLSDYLNRWDGSYILAIATYNAGPMNVERWVETYGDPRTPGVDPVDWIESIPFPETRNYVQRVLENLEVYRNRLGNTDRALSIIADLYRPGTVEADSTKPMPMLASSATTVPPAIATPAESAQR